MKPHLLVRHLPRVDYRTCWQAMREFTARRDAKTPDELWLLEHPAVFTLGQAGKPEHILAPGDVPVVQCDRGGQATLHAPGQTVGYLLLDLARLKIGSRVLVETVEATLVDALRTLGLVTRSDVEAPGIYVQNRKIASLGLRIRHGRTYHGIALNRDMDLALWQRINPCGHAGQAVTSLAAEGIHVSRAQVENQLADSLAQHFGFQLQAAPVPTWFAAATSLSVRESHA